MSVKSSSQHPTVFRINDLIAIRDDLVNSLVRTMISDQTESNIEMLVGDSSALNRDEIQTMLQSVREDTLEYFKDIIIDLQEQVVEQINSIKFESEVVSMHYTSGKLNDIDVIINW